VTPEAGGRLPAEQGSQVPGPGTDPGDTRGGYAAPVPGGAASLAGLSVDDAARDRQHLVYGW
jgi:hypothetical protein